VSRWRVRPNQGRAAQAPALASKELLERLEPDDAAALDLDPDRVTYTTLADLPTATEKARRDAPAIDVCEVYGAGGATSLRQSPESRMIRG
jgi:hypothetical protein